MSTNDNINYGEGRRGAAHGSRDTAATAGDYGTRFDASAAGGSRGIDPREVQRNIISNLNELENVNNLIDETVYGITRTLYERINARNMKYFTVELADYLFKYVVNDKYIMEKLLYVEKHQVAGTDVDGSDLMSRMINERVKEEFTPHSDANDLILTDKVFFDVGKVYDTLGNLLAHRNEISRVNNTTVEHFITLVDGNRTEPLVITDLDEARSTVAAIEAASTQMPQQGQSLADELSLANMKLAGTSSGSSSNMPSTSRKRTSGRDVGEDCPAIYERCIKPKKENVPELPRPHRLQWFYPLPFYCIADINSFDILFKQISTVLVIKSEKIRHKNDVYYRIWEDNRHSCIFFVNEIGCKSYVNIDVNLSGTKTKCPMPTDKDHEPPQKAVPNPLKQFFALSSYENINDFSFIQLIFDAMRNSLNIHFTEKVPYNLIPFEQTREISLVYRLNWTVPVSRNSLIKTIHEKLPSNSVYVLMGQCIDDKFTESDLKYWLNRYRLPQSTFVWRRINCAYNQTATAPQSDKVELVVLLHNNKKLLSFTCSLFDVDKIYSAIQLDTLPSVCLLRQVHNTAAAATYFLRVFQNVAYLKNLRTTIITTSSLWPTTNIKDVSSFATLEQQLIMPEVLVDFFTLNFQLQLIEPVKVLHRSSYAELFSIKFKYFIIYVFGTTDPLKVGQNFVIGDAILQYLYNLSIIKNHNLVENLSFIFELLP